MTKKIYVLSQVTGDIFTILEDEIDTLENYHIPLKSLPSPSCRKCFGRGYIGRRPATNHVVVCQKCMRKCADVDLVMKIARKKLEKQTSAPND